MHQRIVSVVNTIVRDVLFGDMIQESLMALFVFYTAMLILLSKRAVFGIFLSFLLNFVFFGSEVINW